MTEVTSGEPPGDTESARKWRKIRAALFSILARLALYVVVLAMAASVILNTKGG